MPARPVALLALVVGLAAGEATIAVDVALDGRRLDVDGQTEVPRGLFGVHAVALTPELVADLGVECVRGINFLPGAGSKYIDGKTGAMPELYRGMPVLIDCQGDRFCEPLPLREKDWAAKLAAMGKGYGELWKAQTAASGKRGIVQFWNEAYLNWAERSAGERGSTIRNDVYDTSRAVEGGPVTITGWDRPLAHFRWRGLWPVREVEVTDKKGVKRTQQVVGWSVPLPAGAKPGDTFTAAEKRYWREPGKAKEWTVAQIWYPVDPTATGYWSGRQNLDFYRMMFAPWAKALREANPDVTILAGWDFNYDAGDWSVWTELYRPLLQEFPALIDGMTEHHYGIPPQRVQAWYEVGAADAWAITKRRLRSWNTETQGRLDPAVHGASANSPGTEGGVDQKRWEASYNLADMIGLVARMPEKAASRTIHNFAGAAFADCGGAWALRLLKPLRGTLLRATASDQGCWVAAADAGAGRMVVAIYNQRPAAMAIAIDAATPGGRATGGTVRRLVVDDATATLRLDEQPIAAQDGRVRVEIPSRDAAVLVLQGPAGEATATWRRRQFFAAEGGLRRCAAGTPVVSTIEVPAEALQGAASTALRVVIEGGGSTGTLRVNGVEVALRRDLPVTDLPLPAGALRAGANRIELVAGEECLLGMCSAVVERAAK